MKHGQQTWGVWGLFRDSFTVVFATAMISLIGGVALESVESLLLTVIPLLVLLPALNDAIGSIGTITSSRFTSLLYLHGAEETVWKRGEVKTLFRDVGVTGLTAAVYLAVMASLVAAVKGFPLTGAVAGKVVFIAVTCTAALFTVVFGVAVGGGLYVYKQGGDPDNYLVPVTTAVADIGNIVLFSFLVWLLF